MGATLTIEEATERFLARVATPDSHPVTCWEWQGGVNRKTGYGVAWWGGKPQPAHRVAVALADGAWPPRGLVVMHLCDNRRCVRPLHLRVGTQRQNIDDMVSKGRGGRSGAFTPPEVPYVLEPRWVKKYDEEARLGYGLCGRRRVECSQLIDGFCVTRDCVQNRWER